MEQKKSIVILCAGGPAPGINTVISAITKCFIADNYRVLGLNYGFRTLFTAEPDFIEITYDIADRIFDKGGSYLKMSRYRPKKQEFNTEFFEKNNVKLLVTIGGEDTATTANELSKFLIEKNLQVQNIHVPKTIDNDLPLPENMPTFGYQTAKNEGVRIGKNILEDARTMDGWFILSAMGREAGHLALGIGEACHYPMIIISEMFYKVPLNFDRIIRLILSSMIKRKILSLNFGVAIISESVFLHISDEELKNTGIAFTFDEHGHAELGNVSKAHIINELLQRELKKLNLKFRSRPIEVGYELRCTHPIAFDLTYCTNLGYGVKELYDKGYSQCIVLATAEGKYKPLYLKDITGHDGKVKTRLVDVESEEFKVTLKNLEFIEEKDYEKAKKYVPDPENYNLKNILQINY